MRTVVLVVMLALLAACTTKEGPRLSVGVPTTASPASSAAAFCSTLTQFAQELASDVQGATNSLALVEKVQQQATTAESVLRGQEGSMDYLATRTQADVVIGDLDSLATWTPNASVSLQTVISTFGKDSVAFKASYCS